VDFDMQSLPTLEQLPDLLTSQSLDGSQGCNRSSTNPIIEANNDLQAIQSWLNEYSHKKTTYQSYRKEAERLLLWCVIQAKKPLSSINRDDFTAYAEFLENPQPSQLWCGKKGGKGIKRGSEGWKPFFGPLSPSAKVTALSIINSLMTYLYEARYLDSNPLSLMRSLKRRNVTMEEQRLKVYERILADDEWQAVIQTVEEWPNQSDDEKDYKARLRLTVGLLFYLGLRVGDITTSTWQAFKKINNNWWFFVRGKGDKLAKIPVNNELLKIIIDYRIHFDMTVYPHADDTKPLVWSFKNKKKPIGSRQINNIIKQLAEKATEKFPDSLAKQQKLRKLSPHWFRHQSASMQARLGIPAEHIKANMRHESHQTTMIYIHADEEERVKTMNMLSM